MIHRIQLALAFPRAWLDAARGLVRDLRELGPLAAQALRELHAAQPPACSCDVPPAAARAETVPPPGRPASDPSPAPVALGSGVRLPCPVCGMGVRGVVSELISWEVAGSWRVRAVVVLDADCGGCGARCVSTRASLLEPVAESDVRV